MIADPVVADQVEEVTSKLNQFFDIGIERNLRIFVFE